MTRKTKRPTLANLERYGHSFINPELRPFIERVGDICEVQTKTHKTYLFLEYFFWKKMGLLLDARDLEDMQRMDNMTLDTFSDLLEELKETIKQHEIDAATKVADAKLKKKMKRKKK